MTTLQSIFVSPVIIIATPTEVMKIELTEFYAFFNSKIFGTNIARDDHKYKIVNCLLGTYSNS